MTNPQAAVVGFSVMSFLPGVTPAQRDSVQLAALMAERVTRSGYDQGHVQDWYGYYRNQLKYLGWDAVPPEEAHWPGRERPELVDQALRRIDATAGEHFASVTRLALEGLQADLSVTLQLEQRCQSQGIFQLMPCGPAKGGYVDMLVYHESGQKSAFSTGFVFRERSQLTVRAELVRFNTRLFDQQHKSKVQRSLEKVALKEILELTL